MNILQIIGPRPQLIKAHILSYELLKAKINSKILASMQHSDKLLFKDILDELNLKIDYYISYKDKKVKDFKNFSYKDVRIKSSPSSRLALMIQIMGEFLTKEKIDFVIIYGDTDTSLAASLSANLNNIKIIHIESGLRNFSFIPEERNRVLIDNMSHILFTPSKEGLKNLKKEFGRKEFERKEVLILLSGDITKDSTRFFSNALKAPKHLDSIKSYIFVTLHRGENVDLKSRFLNILDSLNALDKKIIFALHLRVINGVLNEIFTKQEKQTLLKNTTLTLQRYENIIFSMPLSYLGCAYISKNADLIITDSGGLQKEAFYYKKPCIVLRKTSEWVELERQGFSVLSDYKDLKAKVKFNFNTSYNTRLYGGYHNARFIAKKIKIFLNIT